jgi:hypothetical protein
MYTFIRTVMLKTSSNNDTIDFTEKTVNFTVSCKINVRYYGKFCASDI